MVNHAILTRRLCHTLPGWLNSGIRGLYFFYSFSQDTAQPITFFQSHCNQSVPVDGKKHRKRRIHEYIRGSFLCGLKIQIERLTIRNEAMICASCLSRRDSWLETYPKFLKCQYIKNFKSAVLIVVLKLHMYIWGPSQRVTFKLIRPT